MATQLEQQYLKLVTPIINEWANAATAEMRRLLRMRLKQRGQESALAESIDFKGTTVSINGTVITWNLNDYYIYIDLGVKGIKNRSKTYTSKEYPAGFNFKNPFVSKNMVNSMQNYVARKGIKTPVKEGETILEASFRVARSMAIAVKRKGIDGTRFYSDVFNEKGFKRLSDKLEVALGQKIEVKILQDFKI